VGVGVGVGVGIGAGVGVGVGIGAGVEEHAPMTVTSATIKIIARAQRIKCL
jgi:hypothetical protein